MMLENGQTECNCKKKKCVRYGDCEECIKHHKNSNRPPYCKRDKKPKKDDAGDNAYSDILDNSIKTLFSNALKIMLENPSYASFMMKTAAWQRKASKIRLKWEREGIHVPPFLITSITDKCNLKCKGCYAQAHRKANANEMDINRIRDLFGEASELGISIILIAGGEPLVRKEILKAANEFPKIVFPIFTNGLLIDEDMIKQFKKQKNTVPVISLEGYENNTDERRGTGVHEGVSKAIRSLGEKNIFFGVSITVTRSNYDAVMSDEFVHELVEQGCKLFFYVEYVPVNESTEELVITDYQRSKIVSLTDRMQSNFQALFIAFPGDEEKFGGCLAAGRGFVHIDPAGNIEPCPFSPFSDANIQ
ncbi:MAG TPA: radical SAM protein, partial [Clostridia bacterium]|nr:radical SAM protein [Clostridia bacterium]